MVLAVELNRTMVLPRLLLDGAKPGAAQAAANSADFG